MKKISLLKRPFVRVLPLFMPPRFTDNPLVATEVNESNIQFAILTQSDFLRELYPSGHKILDPHYYPDQYIYDESEEVKAANGGKGAWMRRSVYRYAAPLQFVILIKQLATLCGEKISLKDTSPEPSEAKKKLFQEWKQEWEDRNMNEMFYQCVKSEKSTGDCALAFWFDRERKFHCRPFSYSEGDTLYDFRDPSTGKRTGFARRYTLADEEGNGVSFVEYWDEKNVYRFRQSQTGEVSDTLRTGVAAAMGLDGYALEEGYPLAHGFNRCPIAYKFSPSGPCWSVVQELIDQYEMNMSLLGENNKATAFTVMYFLGDEIDIKGGVDGRPYAISSPNPDTKVGAISQPQESGNFSLMLKTSLDHILMGSFTVVPPEVRSGDLAGVAVKLIFSPSLELGLAEAKEWNPFVDDMVELFSFGLGIEKGRPSDFNTLSVHGEIIPHIHQNTAELVNNLCQSVLNGILSAETAIENNPFSAPDEKTRVEKEAILENIKESKLEEGMNEYNLQRKKSEE